MSRYLKAALAVLVLALSCSPLLAHGDPQGPPAGQQEGPPRGGFGPGPTVRAFGPIGGQDGNTVFLYRRNDQGDGFGRGRMRQGGRGFEMERGELGLRLLNNPDIRKQVGITDEQAAKIRQQASDFHKAEIRNRADLQVKRLDLQDLMAADKPDRAAIDSKLSEISTAQLAQEKSAVDFRLNMRDAITPAQREKIRQLMMNRRQPGGGPTPNQPSPQGRRGPGGTGGADGRGPRSRAPAPGSQTPPAPPPNGN